MKLIEQIVIQPQNTKWLYDLNENDLLFVDNSFQRKYVWTPKNQIMLIESILIGYPIPEIYLWNTGVESDTGDTKYSIIDGQQRCGAIFQYIANGYKLKDTYLDTKNPIFNRIKNRLFKDLEIEDKKAIWSYEFSVRIVRPKIRRPAIETMFLRLNSNNMTLNPQELRNAEFHGEFIELASELSELPFWDNHKIFGIADRRRMRDVSFVSTLLVFMKKGIEEDIGNKNLNQIYDLYNSEYPEKEVDKVRFEQIIGEVNKIISDTSGRLTLLRRQVHFYTLFGVIFDILVENKELSERQITNYRNLIDNYENEELLSKYFKKQYFNITIYKGLVKEGTRQKSNRFDRHLIIRDVMNAV